MKAAAPASPCVDVCRMDAASGWCIGCLRTIDEIAAWAQLDTAARRAVHDAIALRRATPQARAIAASWAHDGPPTPVQP